MLNKFTLTFLSTMILTACGSGGGSNSTQRDNPLPNNNTPKTQVSVNKPKTTNHSHPETEKQRKKAALVPSQHKVQRGDKTKQTPNLTSEPKAEQPQIGQPDIKLAEPKSETTLEKPSDKIDNPLINTVIFESFNRDGGKFTSSKKWISLKFNDQNKNIQVLPLYEKMQFSDQEVKALLDNSGLLLGYFGYTSFSHIEPNINNLGDESVTHYSLPMLEMDKAQMMRPNIDLNYKGSFYYVYDNQAVTPLIGRVSGNYSAEDKRLFLNLFGQHNEFWELKENPRKIGVKVEENGEIFGQLYNNITRNATFDGGIYGKNGEVLAGTLEYEDHTIEKNGWKGVLEAKAEVK